MGGVAGNFGPLPFSLNPVSAASAPLLLSVVNNASAGDERNCNPGYKGCTPCSGAKSASRLAFQAAMAVPISPMSKMALCSSVIC